MKNAIFITVRSGSKRLPKKSYLYIDGKTTISHLIDRVKLSKRADEVILCTTQLKEDDLLCQIATEHKIKYFRGSTSDKLERWKGACEKFHIDFFVTADGDDIFCEPELIDLAINQYNKKGADFIYSKDIICGAFTYGIKTQALQKVCSIKNTKETEMMSVYFTKTGLFDVQDLDNVPEIYKRNDIRMTLDYTDDLIFFDSVIKELGQKRYYDCQYSLLKNILWLLDRKPEIIQLNYHRHKEWQENQQNKTSLKIKNEYI